MTAQLSDEQIGQQVIQIVAEVAGVPIATIEMTTEFKDLEDRAPGTIELTISRVERQFDIMLYDNDEDVIRTSDVKGLTEIVIAKGRERELSH